MKHIKFDNFDLQVEHIKDESHYNYNLYKVVGNYGDLFFYYPDTLFIKEICHEFENCFEYVLLLKTNNEYIAIMSFVGEERIYDKGENYE